MAPTAHQCHRTARPDRANGRSSNAGSVGPLIERAFSSAGGRPVILDIESPGGSPVQSDLIASMIRRHADQAGVRVHAVIGEVGVEATLDRLCRR